MLDASRSMADPRKFDMARRIAAALCYIGLAHLDKLTILPFGARLGQESAPGRGKGRIFRVFEQLERLEAGGPTDLRASFKEFAARSAPARPDGDHLGLPRPRRLRGRHQDPAHARPRRVRRAHHLGARSEPRRVRRSALRRLRRPASCARSR